MSIYFGRNWNENGNHYLPSDPAPAPAPAQEEAPDRTAGRGCGCNAAAREELVSMTQKMKVKLKDYYHTVVKEFVEAGGSVDSLQQKIMMESSFTVPIKGVAVCSFPSVSGA
ncbi:hypothetical protein CK203_003302 [Vitis vinifera]|uniref:Uncharacterized protein n=1 Tax=Vitis vinifera TaxID=29760 RepID=A0A438K6W3_VITVI|nr:hypothetical protein CK203_003302 [Vitis vinifera]